jgi:hypothetical protein
MALVSHMARRSRSALRLTKKSSQSRRRAYADPTRMAIRENQFIDSDRKKVTVMWAESPDDVEERKLRKELNLQPIPPPPATEAIIVSFMYEQISAIEAEPWSIMTYSFFPTFGTVFIGQQFFDVAQTNTRQMALFAHCQFSWTDPHGH